MKKMKLFLAMIMAVMTFGGMGVVNAVSGSISNSTTNHAVTLSRSVTGVSNAVTNTFTYTVTADAGNPDGATSEPTGGTVVFSGVTPTGTTATATGTIDFAGATYTTNGDYTYTIRETASTDSTTYPLDSTTYKVKVSVRNKSASDFSEKAITMFFYNSDDSKRDNTTMPFTSTAVLRTIELTNTVSGQMADADLYFPITVNIGAAGSTYTVAGQTKDGALTSISSGTDQVLWLKHGETVTISGVIDGASYSISESNEAPYSDYTTTIGGVSGKSLTNQTVGTTNSKAITNQYDGTALTGGFFRTLPYLLIVAAVVAGMVAIVIRNQRAKKYADIEE